MPFDVIRSDVSVSVRIIPENYSRKLFHRIFSLEKPKKPENSRKPTVKSIIYLFL